MICKNCKKDFKEKQYKSEFCCVKCSNLFIGKQKNPIYLLVKDYKNFYDIPKEIIKKLYAIDTYNISKTLKTYGLNDILTGYRNFKNSNKLCPNCNEFYPVKSNKSREVCTNPDCKEYNAKQRQERTSKSAFTKLSKYGDSKFNNREKFKETYKSKSQEELELWNSHRSEALQKPQEEWDIITQKRKETHKAKTGYDNPLQIPENRIKSKISLKDQNVKDKRKSTSLKMYGVECHTQSPIIKEKIKQSNLKNYGVEYISQAPIIKEKIKQSNLKNYGVEYISQAPIIKEKIKQSNLKNYGVPSHTQSPLWKSQTSDKFKEKFGVNFAPQKTLKNLKDYDNKDFWLSNFGEYKNNILYFDFDKICEYFGILAHTTIYNKLYSFGFEFRKKSNYGASEADFLNELNIPNLKFQFKIQNFKVDGFDANTNTIYEFLGDYWHGNLRYFKSNNLNENTKETFGDLCNNTFKRFDKFLKLGYNVKYIWESDYKQYGLSALQDYKDYDKIISNFLSENNIEFKCKWNFYIIKNSNVILWLHRMEALPEYNDNIIHKYSIKSNKRIIHLFTPYIDNPQKFNVLKNLILHALGKSKNKLYARKLNVKVFPAKDVKHFFENNNINGYRNAKYAVCLMQGDEIVMSYSLGHAYFGKGKYDSEIARGACKLGYSIIGGASKLWNYIIKNFDYNTIVYYVDLNFYDGKSINFLDNCTKIGEAPGFWNYWVETQELKNREPNRHKEIIELMKFGKIIEIQNAGAQVNVWVRQ